ncbi:MAG TPA: hypothetical protein VFO48_12850 [Vicinamibacterales bacterium]|nr:hypothetical protein [Vicinamibacterales bacterium]
MNDAIWVLLLSGILGFRVGMLGYPDWQVAVETAQVTAGLVTYPPDNIFYIYHTRLWTVLHQILAVALRAGVSELTLSLIISGVQGMLTFQALALFVYALSRDVLLGVGAAALIFFTRAADHGTIYPLFLLGTQHTYGVVGLSTGVLVMALLGAGWYRTGAFLLGVVPCIHPALGSWTGLVVGLAVLSDFRRLRTELRPALPWFFAGCGVTLASLLIHFGLSPAAPAGMTRLPPEDLSTFIRLWDGHRAAVDIWGNGVRLNVASLIVALVFLTVRLKADPTVGSTSLSSQLLLRIAAASALMALLMIPISWIPPERMPTALLVLMPGRYLNVGALTFVAMLIGVLASRRELWSRVVLLVLTCGLLLGSQSMLWDFLEHHHNVRYHSNLRAMQFVWLSAAALIAGGLWTRRTHGPSEGGPSRWNVLPYATTLAVLGLTVLMTLHQYEEKSGAHFADRTNDVFFADVAAQPGVLLLAGELYLVQLRTRRPVLLDAGALDTVMYSLETGAAMQRMLRDIYGLDLANPPPDAVGAGRIPAQSHQKTWEGYSPEKWRDIRRDFGVTQVLAYAHWTLQLPVASQSRRLLLYDIPER